MVKKYQKTVKICGFECRKDVILTVVIAIAIGMAVFGYASITQLPHLYMHEPGECHMDSECKVGQVCNIGCAELDSQGVCITRDEIGKCIDNLG